MNGTSTPHAPCPAATSQVLDALEGSGESQVQSLLIEEPILELPYLPGRQGGGCQGVTGEKAIYQQRPMPRSKVLTSEYAHVCFYRSSADQGVGFQAAQNQVARVLFLIIWDAQISSILIGGAHEAMD
jgi:hypothetical protein